MAWKFIVNNLERKVDNMNLKSYKWDKFGMIGNGYYDITVILSVWGWYLSTQYIRKYLKTKRRFILKDWPDRDGYGCSNAVQLGSDDGAFVVFSKTRIMQKTEKLLEPYLEEYKYK